MSFYNTFHASRFKESKGEQNDLPSQTIPNEAETIAQMFHKFQNGIPIRSRPRKEADYIQVKHDDPNFHLLKGSGDRLTDRDSLIIPEIPKKEPKKPIKEDGTIDNDSVS